MVENKKVYIPNQNELEKMDMILANNQQNDSNLIKYLQAKQIEYIIAQGGLEFFDSDIKNDIDIVEKVIRYIPADIWCTPFNSDKDLAKIIIENNYPKQEVDYGLDYLNCLSANLYQNADFVLLVVQKLNKILKEKPNYRFNYQNNSLLSSIFATTILKYLKMEEITIEQELQLYKELIEIEPSYITKINMASILKSYNIKYEINYYYANIKLANDLYEAIENYADRYNVKVKNYLPKEKQIKYKKLTRFLEEK